MEMVSLLLVVFGLIICFGGIYIRKFCSSIMGFIWGAFLSVILIVVTTESIWSINREESLVWILLGAIVLAIFSAIYEKVCAFINSFVPTFFIVCVLLLFNILFKEDLKMPAVVVIALFIASISGFISCKICDIAFMLETAFTGAFIASLGIYGLAEGANDVGDLVFGAIKDDEIIGYILLGTVVLGVIGFCIQWYRFKTNKSTKPQKEDNCPENWVCDCGKVNSSAFAFCEDCGKSRSSDNNVITQIQGWICKCGNYNGDDMLFCSECGDSKLQQEFVQWPCAKCGALNEQDMSFCSECGEPKNFVKHQENSN